MAVRLAVGATVAGLAVVGLIVAWYFRKALFNCLGDIFGCAPQKTHAVQSKDLEGGAIQVKPTAQGSVIGVARPGPQPASAPMIVVATDDASRGEVMNYQTLRDACLNWNAGNILGKGAASTVYRGSLPRFGSVAVKRFHSDPAGGMPYNFDRELEALCQPLMEGGTLASALGSMAWAARATCFSQIVRAVSFLHGKKMVHRDIKSSNILMDGALRHARLADFGLAKDQVKGSRTHGTTGIVVGSPGYMAPELMMRKDGCICPGSGGVRSSNTEGETGRLSIAKTAGFVTGGKRSPLSPETRTERRLPALNDYAVSDNKFQESLVDAKASWPPGEVGALGDHAVKLTYFDPNQRQKARCFDLIQENDALRQQLAERARDGSPHRSRRPAAEALRLALQRQELSLVKLLTGLDPQMHGKVSFEAFQAACSRHHLSLQADDFGKLANVLNLDKRGFFHKEALLRAFRRAEEVASPPRGRKASDGPSHTQSRACSGSREVHAPKGLGPVEVQHRRQIERLECSAQTGSKFASSCMLLAE
eukprot:s489_g4.t1